MLQQLDPALVGIRQNPRCCKCHQPIGRSASRGKWPSIRHNPRCPADYTTREPTTAAAVAAAAASAAPAPLTPRKRRVQSDPGELPAHATPPALTRRVTPPSPVKMSKKQRVTRQEERIMRLLDETHARRMAAEAAAAAPAAPAAVAAAAATAADEQGTAHTGFTVVFVP